MSVLLLPVRLPSVEKSIKLFASGTRHKVLRVVSGSVAITVLLIGTMIFSAMTLAGRAVICPIVTGSEGGPQALFLRRMLSHDAFTPFVTKFCDVIKPFPLTSSAVGIDLSLVRVVARGVAAFFLCILSQALWSLVRALEIEDGDAVLELIQKVDTKHMVDDFTPLSPVCNISTREEYRWCRVPGLGRVEGSNQIVFAFLSCMTIARVEDQIRDSH